MTRDRDFGNVLDYPPEDYFGLVVVEAPEHANRALVLRMLDRFLGESKTVENLVGRLAIVEPGRFRLRPA